jgi:hypothetical protein
MYGGRRHTDRDRNENDYYPTPPFATFALCESDDVPYRIWEPACGKGHMSKELERLGHEVHSSDLEEYPDVLELKNKPYFGLDFLKENYVTGCDAIVTNPPYASDMAMKFVLRALDTAIPGCNYAAFLCRMNFIEGSKRYQQLFQKRPPTRIQAFTNRFSCWEENFDNPLGGMVNFAWWVWDYRNGETKYGDTRALWINTYSMFDKWWISMGRPEAENPRLKKKRKK